MGNIQYTVPVCILVEKESRQSVWWEAKLLGDFLLGEINIFVRNEIVVVAAETAQEIRDIRISISNKHFKGIGA